MLTTVVKPQPSRAEPQRAQSMAVLRDGRRPLHVEAGCGEKHRVCEVSGYSAGIPPFRNEGKDLHRDAGISRVERQWRIGTFYTSLAETLANDGHQITVLYSGSANRSNDLTFLKCQEDCLVKGIEIACLPENWEFGSSKFSFRHRSFKVMRWLEQRDGAFDIVHFPDWEGMGYYPALLKHQGLALQTTLLVVGLHGPTLWSMDSVRLLSDLRMLDFDFIAGLERTACRRRLGPRAIWWTGTSGGNTGSAAPSWSPTPAGSMRAIPRY